MEEKLIIVTYKNTKELLNKGNEFLNVCKHKKESLLNNNNKDSVDASIQRLKDYIQKHEGGLITATRHETENTMNNRMTITRKQKWEGKQLYGRFK